MTAQSAETKRVLRRAEGRASLQLLALLVAAAGVALGGCAFIGWGVNAFAPPKKVDAVYDPPKDKKVLVFVDDLVKPVAYEPIKAELTEQLNAQLLAHHLAKEVIPYNDLLTLMSAEPEFNRLAVCEVGSRLGADHVLFVEIDDFILKDDEESPLWHGHLEASVRLVDAEGNRLWPDDRTGGQPAPVVDIPAQSSPSPNFGAELSKVMAGQMADHIAKLFYRHEISAQEYAERETKK